jgi:ketosteroid isomerase-like protein
LTTATLRPIETVREYYRRVDEGDFAAAFELWAPRATVRFGDRPEVEGRDAIAQLVTDMVVPIAQRVSHVIVRTYEVDGPGDNRTVICEAVVTYKMLRSGSVISHNAVTISEISPTGGIVAQRNVGDLRPVIEDHQAHSRVGNSPDEGSTSSTPG